MEALKEKIKILVKEYHSLKPSLRVDGKKLRLSELEKISSNPNLWDDQDLAKKVMQELGDLKNEVEEITKLEENINVLKGLADQDSLDDTFFDEVNRIEGNLAKLKLASLLSGVYDRRNAIVSIHAGQGGTEAMDWASMLYRMYIRFSEKRGWKTEALDMSSGEEAGIKSVTFMVNGHYAYGYLKGEAGTHRLVRQSPFNADKLRQTSFALVEVLPELDEVDIPDISVKDEELEWQFFRASTQGGQNVQKVSTAVRVKHLPTQIVVTAQTERFQEQNRKIALNLLRAKLWVLKQEEQKREVKSLKGEYHPASWGTQIRSYVLHPYKMVKDLRTQVESSNPEAILSGELDSFIEANLSK